MTEHPKADILFAANNHTDLQLPKRSKMVVLSMKRRRGPPPNLRLDIPQEQHQERAVKSPGPLTPNRPLIGSDIPIHPTPQQTISITSTHVPLPSNGPADTLPQIPTTTQPAVAPSSSAPPKSPTLRPIVSVSRTTVFFTTTRPQSSVLPSPTSTVFVTAAPQTITVTAPSIPTPSNDLNGDSGSKPQPEPQPLAIWSTQGVSFTSGSGVVVLGVLGGIGKSNMELVSGSFP
ncbi:hypothetical protein CSAL01_06251 [Colletotrichum salicis]|uniref:Uncharacterized protein n=1 Tax=Colletotrichum salicis TaxID=1209931 RepID=A0A135V744_9PEZI|nr:hypothetical protein CSAL01_06251 [Colletotrichum salicis]